MPTILLKDFRSKLTDAARPNRFLVRFSNLPALPGIKDWMIDDDWYQCKTASIPAKEVGSFELDWQGMKRKIGGDPTYGDLTLGFWSHEDYGLRLGFEQWIEYMAGMLTNERGPGGSKDTAIDYKTNIIVSQLGRGDASNVLEEYAYDGCFPTSVAEIGLDQSSADTPQEFDVTFAVDVSDHVAIGASKVL